MCICFDLLLICSVADALLSTTPVRPSYTRRHYHHHHHPHRHHQQLSNPQSAAERSVEVATPSSAGCSISNASASAADNPSETRNVSVEAGNIAADAPEALIRVQTASNIVVEVKGDARSTAPEVVHRRRRKKAKKKSSVTFDEPQSALSSRELSL